MTVMLAYRSLTIIAHGSEIALEEEITNIFSLS